MITYRIWIVTGTYQHFYERCKTLSHIHVQHVAHRGGSALAPENTMAAFRNALTLPVDAIELDVHMSRDGHAVVFHDNSVERLTDGTGNIADLDFAYLRCLNASAHFAGGWPEPQHIPALREVLELAQGHVQVYIELKTSKRGQHYGRYPNIVETVVAEVRSQHMLADVLIMSFDWALLPIVKTLEPKVQTGALVSDDAWDRGAANALETLLKQVSALDCNWINMDSNLFTPGMPDKIHEHGFKLGLWTVNNLQKIQRCAAAGVDSITSDQPDLFAKLA
jgi:glycerophosphoryl diester phosphodiesterase